MLPYNAEEEGCQTEKVGLPKSVTYCRFVGLPLEGRGCTGFVAMEFSG